MIELNGKDNGIAVMVSYENNNNPKFIIATKENRIRLFNNLEVAKTIAKTVNGILPKIKYFISIGDKMYPIEDCMKTKYGYRIIDNKQIIDVKEKIDYRASNFSYIVFENGDTVRCDKKYGYKRSNELIGVLEGAIELTFADNFDDYGIKCIERDEFEYIIHLRNNTASIHIMTNSNLMKVNQARKDNNEKVFPFNKDMDKFTTFYIFISRDITEPSRINSEDISLKIIDRIMEHLKTIEPETDIKVSKVGYNGYVYFSK